VSSQSKIITATGRKKYKIKINQNEIFVKLNGGDTINETEDMFKSPEQLLKQSPTQRGDKRVKSICDGNAITKGVHDSAG
jgi:hypothetical protein